jgi:DNA-binding response OmpR family regulator
MSRPASPKTRFESAERRQVRLLIIEDDNVHRMIIKRFATALGFDIAEATSYESTVALFDTNPFDCITLDLSIRARSGIDVLCHLRDIGQRVPVLIISGADEGKRSETAQFAELMNFKVLHAMKKPLDLHALQQSLEKLKTFVHISADTAE